MSATIASKDSDFGSSVEDANRSVRHFEFTGANKIWFAEQITLVDQARRRRAEHPDDSSRLSLPETQARVIIDALQKIQKQQGFVDDSAIQYLAYQLGCDISSVEIMMRQFNEGPFNNNFYKFDTLQSFQSRFSMILYPKFSSLPEWAMFNIRLSFSQFAMMMLVGLAIAIICVFISFFDHNYVDHFKIGPFFYMILFIGFPGFFRGILGLVFPPRYLLRAALSRKLMR